MVPILQVTPRIAIEISCPFPDSYATGFTWEKLIGRVHAEGEVCDFC